MPEIGNLVVKLIADTEKFNKSLTNAQETLTGASRKMESAGKSMSKYITLPAVAAATGLFALVQKTANAGDAIQKMSLRTGLSATALSELKHAAELSGTSLEGLEIGVRRMQKVIYDAEKGLSTANDALKYLGVSLTEIQGLSPEEQFFRLASAIADIEDPSLRAALAQEVFGRAGTRLLPMLAEGSEGLEAMRQEAHELGIVFDQDAANAAARFNDDMLRLKQSFAGAFMELGNRLIPIFVNDLIPAVRDNLIPIFQNFIERIINLVEWFTSLDESTKKVIAVIAGLVVGIGPALLIGSKLVGVVSKIIEVKNILTTKTIPALGKAFSWLAANPVVLIIAAIAALIAIGIYLYKNWDEVKVKLLAIWEVIKASAEFVAIKIQQAWYGLQRAVFTIVQKILNGVAPLIDWLPASMTKGFDRLRRGVADNLSRVRQELDNLDARARDNFARMQDALRNAAAEFRRPKVAAEDFAFSVDDAMQTVTESVTNAGIAIEEAIGGSSKYYEMAKVEISQLEQEVEFLSRRMEQQKQVVADLEERLNLAKEAYEATTNQVREMERAISDTERMIQDFGRAPLAEAKALQDEMWAVEQETAAVELALLRLEMSGGPAEEAERLKKELEVLRNRAKELRLREKLEIDPLRRELEQLVDTTQYLTFAQARQGALDAQQKLLRLRNELTGLIATQQQQEQQMKRVEIEYNLQKEALDRITEAHSQAKDAVRELQSAIKDMTDMTIKQYEEMIAKINEAREAMQKQLQAAKSAASTAGKVSTAVGTISTAGLTAHQAAVISMPEFAKMSAAGQRSLAKALGIPGFQQGGIVPGPLGAPRLVLAHGGEAIVPPKAAAGAGGINITLNVYGSVGVKDIAEQLVREIRQKTGIRF